MRLVTFALLKRTAMAQGLWPVLFGLVAGTVAQLQQAELWDIWVYVLFALLALVLYAQAAIKNRANVWFALAALVCAAVLAFSATGLRSHLFLSSSLNPALEGRDIAVVGVVANLPQSSEAGLRFRLAVESARLDGSTIDIPPLVDVGWYGGVYPTGTEVLGLQRQPAQVRAGERWEMTLRLKAPHGSRNPHGFDYELWLWEQGVQATGYVRAGSKDPIPRRMTQTWKYPVALARQNVREQIYAQVEQRQVAGLIAALVLGDQNAIDRVDWDVFRATGVAHLMAISGLHITMFAWGASLLLAWLWRLRSSLCLWVPAPTVALLGGVVLAVLYSVFAGWGIPAQRTCIMLITVTLLRLSGARWPWPLVWLLACAAIVVADPWALLQAGFWLSFVAVGILFATDSGAANATNTRVRAKFVSAMHGQGVIALALAPLTLLLFGQVSLVGLLANLIAIPWVTLVVTPLAMLGVLIPATWDLAGLTIALMMQCLQWLSVLPWATTSMAMPPLWVAVSGTLGALLLVMRLPWGLRGMGVALLLPLAFWRPLLPGAGEFELMAADVGQGNAVLVRTANHALLYDAGPRYSLESDAGHRVLLPLLGALHTRLDRVVLSHRDTDHVGGAAAVLAMQPQADLWSSIGSEHPLNGLRTVYRCEAGQHWEWDGVQFEVLHPAARDYDKVAKPNALSCVLRISNPRQSALLAGDIEAVQETALVAEGAPLQSNVLLVPHHGSKTSSSGAFLDAVNPEWALVQSGYRNRFGHPVQPVMERYEERHIVVRDSPHCGAMVWKSESPTELNCTRMEQLRYWHHRLP